MRFNNSDNQCVWSALQIHQRKVNNFRSSENPRLILMH